jgi:hypothetical protein
MPYIETGKQIIPQDHIKLTCARHDELACICGRLDGDDNENILGKEGVGRRRTARPETDSISWPWRNFNGSERPSKRINQSEGEPAEWWR